ncbi:MAG TPA: MlaD family protein [Candidatus Binatia bacterium]|nr:MlaD family protein [Candidatus Binatia bacterium]
MDEGQNYRRLGLFVLVTLALLAAILFILGGRSLFQPTFTFETYFNESVAGLEIGASVKYRGVPLGQVTEILTAGALYQENLPLGQRKPYIVVRAKVSGTSAAQTKLMQTEIREHVAQGLRVQTQLAGITGQQYLALDYLNPKTYPPLEFDWTPKYPYVPSAPSLTGEIITNAQSFIASLNQADVKDLGQNLNKLIVNLNEKLDKVPLAEISTELKGALKSAHQTIDRVDRVIAGAPIDETVQKLASASARLDKLLADPGLQQTVDNAAAFTERLRKIGESGELDRVVRNIDETIQRLDGMLGDNQYDVRTILQDLRVTVDNLRTFSESIKRYPAGALVGGPPEKVVLPKESK